MPAYPTLKNRSVTLAVTGGIAAYKSCELVRLLKKAGADVRVIMTEAAAHFVTPLTFEALCGHAVGIENLTRDMPHLAATHGACDLMIVAPATADILGKAAHGIADNLVSTAIIARAAPLAVCPAMNTRMWENPAVQRSVKVLADDGVMIWGPQAGNLACGETGAGRMMEPEDIVELAAAALAPKTLTGKKAVVTAGPTEEPLDPVRVITNRSSGLQGYALARSLMQAGCDTVLISGPTALTAPAGVRVISVKTADEMHTAALKETQDADIFAGVAAVCDWKTAEVAPQKMKKTPGKESLTLTFVKNPDILADVKKARPTLFAVGFAAETENLEANARTKCVTKGADLIVGNLAPAVFGKNENTVIFGTKTGVTELPTMTKDETAQRITDFIAASLKDGNHA